MLKLQIEGNENEKIQVLQSMLDDLKEQKNELETENRYFHYSHLIEYLTNWILLDIMILYCNDI